MIRIVHCSRINDKHQAIWLYITYIFIKFENFMKNAQKILNTTKTFCMHSLTYVKMIILTNMKDSKKVFP